MQGLKLKETITFETTGPDGTIKDKVQIVTERQPGPNPVVTEQNKMMHPASSEQKGESDDS